jgi:hypothetical protein
MLPMASDRPVLCHKGPISKLGFGLSWHAVGSLVGQAIVPAGGLQAAAGTKQTTYAICTYFLGLGVSRAWCSEDARNSSRNKEAG